jgi:hypothetical protein
MPIMISLRVIPIFIIRKLRNGGRAAEQATGKTSWNSLPEETSEKMQRPMPLTILPGFAGWITALVY